MSGFKPRELHLLRNKESNIPCHCCPFPSITKYIKGEHYAKVVMDGLIIFLSFYFKNPTKFLPSVCRVQAGLFCHLHCKENPIYVFLFWELRCLSPNFHIHVSVRDLYIPRISPHISLQQNRQTDLGNI
jgi:hypothetical protein